MRQNVDALRKKDKNEDNEKGPVLKKEKKQKKKKRKEKMDTGKDKNKADGDS